MGYPTKLLSAGEVIKVDLKPHWLYFLGPATVTIVSIIVAILVVLAWDVSWASWFVAIAIIVGACWLVGRFVRWLSTYFVITNDKVIYRSGVFKRSGVQIPLERVNSVNFEQNLFERMVGAGDLIIESGGMGGPAKFTDVRHPDTVQVIIHDAIEENARGLNPYSSEAPTAHSRGRRFVAHAAATTCGGSRRHRPARAARGDAAARHHHQGRVRRAEGQAARAVVRVVSLVPSVTETLLALGSRAGRGHAVLRAAGAAGGGWHEGS